MTTTHKFAPFLEGLTGCFVAGGAVTSTYTNKPVADIDVYPKSWAALEEAILWAYDNSLWCVFASKRAITFASHKEDHPNIQFMIFDQFPSAEAIFKAFDFTVCMGAYDLDEKKFILHDQFLLHCAQRFISFNRETRFPYASAWRVRKYEEKGYTIGKMEFQKILMACAEKPIQSWDDLKEQIGGVYGEAFDVPEDEPFSIEAAHRAMATIRPAPPQNPFECAEDAILSAVPIEREFYIVENEHGGTTTFIRFGDEFIPRDGPPSLGKPVAPFGGSGVFYKKVLKGDDGTLRSHYKKSFIYEVGKHVESPSPFMWVVQTVDAARDYSAWSSSGRSAIIEIKADLSDILWDGTNVKIKRGLVAREVPDEKAEALAA